MCKKLCMPRNGLIISNFLIKFPLESRVFTTELKLFLGCINYEEKTLYYTNRKYSLF